MKVSGLTGDNPSSWSANTSLGVHRCPGCKEKTWHCKYCKHLNPRSHRQTHKPPKAAGDRVGWHKGTHDVGHANCQQLLVGIDSVVVLTGWGETGSSKLSDETTFFGCLDYLRLVRCVEYSHTSGSVRLQNANMLTMTMLMFNSNNLCCVNKCTHADNC